MTDVSITKPDHPFLYALFGEGRFDPAFDALTVVECGNLCMHVLAEIAVCLSVLSLSLQEGHEL